MVDERPQLEIPKKAEARTILRRIRLVLWITLPLLLLTYPFLMDGVALLLWGKTPSNVPGVIKIFQTQDYESGEKPSSDFPERWSVETELFIDREDSHAIYVFPESGRSPSSKQSPPPLFRLNLETGSLDRVANPDPLGFISIRCEGFRSLGRLKQSFSGISLPEFDPSLFGGGQGLFHQHYWGRDHITLHLGHEDLFLGDIPISGSRGQFPGLVEAFQDPSRRCLLLHTDECLIVLNPEWSRKLPIYPWASVRVSNSDWNVGSPNPMRSAELRILDGRWVVSDFIRLDEISFPLRDISLLVSPPAGFSFAAPEAEPFETWVSDDQTHSQRDMASKVAWKDVPEGRVFAISRLPEGGGALVLPIRLQGPNATPNALPLVPYSATNALQRPVSRYWFFQAGSISFIQGTGAAPPPALQGEPWFNWRCESSLASTRGQALAPDRREAPEPIGMGSVGKPGP